jgi:glutathionylspermidine synthase
MKPSNPEFRQTQQEQQTANTASANHQTALEFTTGDEAIRHDAAQTALPASIAERLRKSIEQESPKPTGPWWKRLFGNDK